ncbi:hypothetical protein HYD88_01020 [Mycoplasmopsis bovis]|nr:hypothetical protein HYD88_01020 [Mycoplasmopsis bovis]
MSYFSLFITGYFALTLKQYALHDPLKQLCKAIIAITFHCTWTKEFISKKAKFRNEIF